MEVETKSNKIFQHDKKFMVEYEKELYDLKDFIHKHPGGLNILQHKNHKNIDLNFKNSNHSLAAKYLLKQYKIKSDTQTDESLEVIVMFILPKQINNRSFMIR